MCFTLHKLYFWNGVVPPPFHHPHVFMPAAFWLRPWAIGQPFNKGFAHKVTFAKGAKQPLQKGDARCKEAERSGRWRQHGIEEGKAVAPLKKGRCTSREPCMRRIGTPAKGKTITSLQSKVRNPKLTRHKALWEHKVVGRVAKSEFNIDFWLDL